WNNLQFLRGPISAMLGAQDQTASVGECAIKKGERLVLLTDGLTERALAPAKWINEREFFTSLIEAHGAYPKDQAAFLDDLLSRSDTLAKSTPQDDDITVVALDF
ncbi:MAG: SpoIIE family protein phosphatase, partial [Bdellovibrionales bacterium]